MITFVSSYIKRAIIKQAILHANPYVKDPCGSYSIFIFTVGFVLQSMSSLEMENEIGRKKFSGHVVVVPYSTLGHTNPMLQFAKNLASKGLLVSFVSLHYDHTRIEKAREYLNRLSLAVPGLVRLEWIPDEIPPEVPIDRHINDFLFYHMHHTMTGHGLESLLLRFNASANPVSCVVYDSFLPWVPKIAAKLSVPHAFFWTQSASVFSLYHHFKTVEKWHGEGNFPESFNVPCLGEFNIRDLPSKFHRVGGALDFFGDLDYVTDASWVLINSFDELEHRVLDYLSRLVRAPILTVGPSIPSAFLEGGNPEDKQVGEGSEPWEVPEFISKWLDSKPPLSVIYVSFGSITSISPNQIREIAEGLERSQQSFLWVIRPPKGHQDLNPLLPPGFLERIQERGLMVEWCVQLEVLSHPSMGVFMSHCGWNSTLDALSSGVPMLTLEIWTDQPPNAKCVADVWKIGRRMKKGEDGVVGMQEIERCVRSGMEGGEEFAELRKNSLRWKEAAARAMRPGGSSDANLSRFTRELAAIAA
ncbi:mogroside IE synthase isoform X1 [Cryptomeria japonica]|uniref:mogroside IE synthase isoform X1 n=2 Tax=Cryptomeria japonica TaxID=3369 RepID=UPI0027DA3D24|nr:mogroside IE synthase isoform X1 [Cryptomeria japonica]